MGTRIGIDPLKARAINDACSDFSLPKAPRAELMALSHEEWMAQYGDTLSSEQYFESREPNWQQNRDSWWYKSVGRSGKEQPPLWMQSEWRSPELDCPPGKDREELPVDQRPDKPIWAERMGLSGSKLGPQSTTIYGHRKEYKPTEKTAARSMYERYQPSFERVVNEELPDVADPADGRFWAAGVAQGVTTNPYEKRLTISARRKPIVLGPRSMSVVVDGEGHTLANVVKDVAWLNPTVEMSGYSCEHPVYKHVNMRIQTIEGGGTNGERAMAETLELTKELFLSVKEKMENTLADNNNF